MSATIATRSSIRRPRRVLLSVGVVAALAVGAGAAAVSLGSSDGSTSRPTNPAPAVATNVDIHALWNQLSALPASEERTIVAGLAPSVRARLRAIGEETAAVQARQ